MEPVHPGTPPTWIPPPQGTAPGPQYWGAQPAAVIEPVHPGTPPTWIPPPPGTAPGPQYWGAQPAAVIEPVQPGTPPTWIPPPQGTAPGPQYWGAQPTAVIVTQPFYAAPMREIHREPPPGNCFGIFCACLCCPLLAIVALIKDHETRQAWRDHNQDQVWRLSRTTRQWIIASIVVGLVVRIVWQLMMIRFRRQSFSAKSAFFGAS